MAERTDTERLAWLAANGIHHIADFLERSAFESWRLIPRGIRTQEDYANAMRRAIDAAMDENTQE